MRSTFDMSAEASSKFNPSEQHRGDNMPSPVLHETTEFDKGASRKRKSKRKGKVKRRTRRVTSHKENNNEFVSD